MITQNNSAVTEILFYHHSKSGTTSGVIIPQFHWFLFQVPHPLLPAVGGCVFQTGKKKKRQKNPGTTPSHPTTPDKNNKKTSASHSLFLYCCTKLVAAGRDERKCFLFKNSPSTSPLPGIAPSNSNQSII